MPIPRAEPFWLELTMASTMGVMPRPTDEWIAQADEILMEHGAVTGADVYVMRPHARRRAQAPIGRLVDLGVHERSELVEHTERHDGGWVWSVEFAALLRAPDAVYVRGRWIPRFLREWAKECDRVLVERGEVSDGWAYVNRSRARYRAQRLIRLLVELRLRERWQLREHVAKSGGGWFWAVRYDRNGHHPA